MKTVRLAQSCIVFLLLITMSICHVLVAGTDDAFKSLAKSYVSKALAEKLVDLVSQANTASKTSNVEEADEEYQDKVDPTKVDQAQPEQLKENQDYENKDIVNSENIEQEYQAEVTEEYEGADDKANLRVNQENNPDQPKQMQVNLDELVEKVRERLLDELKTTDSSPGVPDLRLQKPQKKQQDYNDNFNDNNSPQKKKVTQTTNEPKHLYKTNKEKKGVVIETGDLYDKVKLTKKKKDSYEDYAKKLPKKDYDIFETEEEIRKPKNVEEDERPNNKLKSKKQEKLGNRINPKRTRPTTQKTGNGINSYAYADMNVPTINPQTTSDNSVTTTPVEYVDDDYRTVASTIEHIPKAATEYIGGPDYNDDSPARGRKTTTEEPVQYPKKRKTVKKKIVTNMQVRLRYTVPTPDFYGKLPRVAEKYNFEEPIPERDREKDDIKQIGPPPSIINGNVKV